MSNIIHAIINIINDRHAFNEAPNGGGNMMNARGDSLDFFVRDAFAGTFGETGGNQRWADRCFSYLGSAHNPPDMILRGGDAIEVKKEKGIGQLLLNSSCPIDVLSHDNPKISNDARVCDGGNWQQKDILYIIGKEPNTQSVPQTIWMIYGDCLSPHDQVFRNLEKDVKKAIESIPNYTWVETNELAKAINVDPLHTTELRVRAMWMLNHPHDLFQHCVTSCIKQNGNNYNQPEIFAYNRNANFQMYVLMKSSKFNSLPQNDIDDLIAIKTKRNDLLIEDVRIADPNNIAVTMNCKLICYSI